MKSDRTQSVSSWLERSHPLFFSSYCIAAAFGTYFCMYAFRKPFTAGEFQEDMLFGMGYKTVLVASQLAGYTLSKFVGIKLVSELPGRYRALTILILIAIAELALLLFAMTPPPYNFLWLFVNGLPLGLVFGMVLGFLEGRQVTEALSAGLCASFIFSSGVVKSVGRSMVQDWGVSEYWMPFLTGLVFLFPLLVSVALLSRIPPPSNQDEILRSKRSPMDRADRIRFFRRHAFGLSGLVVIFILLTIGRSLRDDFGVEIWKDLGVDKSDVFARSEFWVMIGVTAVNGCVIAIRSNRTAFQATFGLLLVGFLLSLAAVVGHWQGWFSPMVFMVLLGMGLYIPYVAFHTTVFERLIAVFRETATIGYLMYLADATGYLGYVGLIVAKNLELFPKELNYLNLLLWVSLLISIVSSVLTIGLMVYYDRRLSRFSDSPPEQPSGV